MSNSGVLKNSNSDTSKNEKGILLTREDVIKLRTKKIFDWPDPDEIWALRYGLIGLGISNVITNVSIDLMYRRNFLIKTTSGIGIVSSLMLTSIFPTAISASTLGLYYTNKLLAPAQDECNLCREVKSVSLHLFIGSIIPTFFAWNSNYFQASVFNSYALPDTNWLFNAKKRKQFLYHFKKVFFNTNKNTLATLGLNYSIQIVLATMVLFYQQKQFHEIIEPLKFNLSEIKEIKFNK